MKDERLAKAGAVSLLGSAFSAGSALVLTVIVGRGLGVHGTGLFFQAVGFFTIISQVLRLGTNSGLTRFLSEQQARGTTERAGRIIWIALIPVLVLCAVVTGVLLLSADELALLMAAPGESEEFASLIRMMAPFIAFAAVTAVLQAAVRMLRGVWLFTLLQNILLPLSRLGLVTVAVLLGWNVSDTLLSWVASIPLWLVVSAGLLIKPLREHRAGRQTGMGPSRGAEARQFWAFSWARGFSAAFEIGLDWADVLIVAALRSPAEAGVYAVATRAVRAGQVVDRAMRVAVSPTIARLLALNEVASARDLHTKVSRAMILATWPFYLTLIVMAPAILRLFGNGFGSGAPVLGLLGAVMMLAAAAGMLQSILLMGGKSSWQMFNKGAALVLSVCLNLVLVQVWGIVGAAVTWAVVVAADTSLAAFQVHRKIGINLQPRKLVSAAVMPLFVFGGGGLVIRSLFGTTGAALVIHLLVLGSIYLALLWRYKGVLGIGRLWQMLPSFSRRRAPNG